MISKNAAAMLLAGMLAVSLSGAAASAATASAPVTAGKQVPLVMDIQVPRTPGPKPLVVFLPGGGFVVATATSAVYRPARNSAMGLATPSW